MAQLIDQFKLITDYSSGLTLVKALISMLLSFGLGLLITYTYRKTHNGRNYSQSFVHTIIIMGVVLSLIMIVIGNNIAVAFGLVGAFSIIRFRTAMSDPKDIGFIFFSMAAGTACGLGYYLLAALFTLGTCLIIYGLYGSRYGAEQDNKTLKITIPENLSYEHMFDDIFEEHLEMYRLLEVETINFGAMFQLVYSIRSYSESSDKELIDAIRERNGNMKVSIVMTGLSN